MGLSSQGKEGSSGLNNLKDLIEKTKNEYQNIIHNYNKWPCPFCINHSKSLIQCRIHILREHKSTCNGDTDFLNDFQNIYNISTKNRSQLKRNCKTKPNYSSYNINNDLDEFLLLENQSKICKCNKTELDDKEKLIGCKNCKKWYHGICLSLTNIDVEKLSIAGWLCNECLNLSSSQNLNNEEMQPCPHCGKELEHKLYKIPTGLKIHCTRKHPNITNSQSNTNHTNSESKKTESMKIDELIKNLAYYKTNIKVLKRIPKGARTLAAHSLSNVIDTCIVKNDLQSWSDLLTFCYKAFQIPPKKSKSASLTRLIKKKINDLVITNIPPTHKTKQASLSNRIESKVAEGDIRGAIKLLVSTDSLAKEDENTFEKLKEKHPSPSRPLEFPAPPNDTNIITVEQNNVRESINTFANGSASGIDGIRPQHLKDLTGMTNGDAANKVLQSITKLSNLMLSGQVLSEICKIVYGATLCGLTKKDGGIRPIAVGLTFRRLTAKLACKSIGEETGEYLRPKQMGFNTRGGCEAAVHATRTYLINNKNTNNIAVKIDFSNAFNSLERDIMLKEIKEKTPSIYGFMWQCYSAPTLLFFGSETISSEVGAQQGDPCGPMAFSLSIQPIIEDLAAELNIWFLDDGTLCGEAEVVLADFEKLIKKCDSIGLHINTSKCELYFCSTPDNSIIEQFNKLSPGIRVVDIDIELLGAALFPSSTAKILEKKLKQMKTMFERLLDLNHHIAFYLLKHCLAIPKLTYILRTHSLLGFTTEIQAFDNEIKSILEKLINSSLNETQWTIASLPIHFGGMGVRKVSDVAFPAFLSSVNSVSDLVKMMLPKYTDESCIADYTDNLSSWLSINNNELPVIKTFQKYWDRISINRIRNTITNTSDLDKARMNASTVKESSAWLTALPSRSIGTLLDNNTFRISIALRLGCDMCTEHKCRCGKQVNRDGLHGLSCKFSASRHSRHSEFNNIICRTLSTANVPSILEPPGLIRENGKRPDGMTLIPWFAGKMLVWDATISDTLAPSYLNKSSKKSGSIAEQAATKKRYDYRRIIEQNYIFVPFACETLGPWCDEAHKFVNKLMTMVTMSTGEIRAKQYFSQRISIALQRANAACIMGTFEERSKLEEIFYILK